jgi:hypothetical protein
LKGVNVRQQRENDELTRCDENATVYGKFSLRIVRQKHRLWLGFIDFVRQNFLVSVECVSNLLTNPDFDPLENILIFSVENGCHKLYR